MIRFTIATVLLMLASSALFAEDVAFRRTQIVDGKNHTAKADLVFSTTTHSMSLRMADRVVAEVPYDQIDKMSYEFTKKHRITQGAIVMVASLGAGAVVMLTNSKSHWLYVDYKDNSVPKTLVLRMDKKEYKDIIMTAQGQTGKEVLFTSGTRKI
jgi:hypothetical protein